MSTFDFCIGCRKVIPATENSYILNPGEGPRCADCAAKQCGALPHNVQKAFSLIAKAKEAAMALRKDPGFHSDLWYETFVTVGFANLEALNAPLNDPKDVCHIGIAYCDHLSHLMDILEDVDRNRIDALRWMQTWRPLRSARRSFDAELDLMAEAAK
jgi:hypothetical protein